MGRNFFSGKKVFITGHTGFKGSWLCELLLHLGADVSGYALKPSTNPSMFEALGIGERVESSFSDIRDAKKLGAFMQSCQPEIVFHLAAQPLVRDSYDDPLYTFETNVMGTANVLQAIRGCPSAKAGVIITTDKVYANKEWDWPYRENDELGGHDPYSASKACAEFVTQSYVKSFFIEGSAKDAHPMVATARAGNVIGGGDWSKDRLVPDIVRHACGSKTPTPLPVRNPSSVRPWQHVLDPLYGYLMLAERLSARDASCLGAWNFSPSEDSFISVGALVEKARKILGKGSHVVKPESGKHEMKMLKLDSSKARSHLGWKPKLNLDKGLDWAFSWYLEYYGGKRDMREYTKGQISRYLSGEI